jgi:hypothetical protein
MRVAIDVLRRRRRAGTARYLREILPHAAARRRGLDVEARARCGYGRARRLVVSRRVALGWADDGVHTSLSLSPPLDYAPPNHTTWLSCDTRRRSTGGRACTAACLSRASCVRRGA